MRRLGRCWSVGGQSNEKEPRSLWLGPFMLPESESSLHGLKRVGSDGAWEPVNP